MVLIMHLLVAGHSESPSATISMTAAVADQQLQPEGNPASVHKNGSSNGKDEDTNPEDLDLHKRYGV